MIRKYAPILSLIALLVAMSFSATAQSEESGRAACAKHLDNGGQLLKSGNIDGANKAFAEAIAADPRCADAYYYKAVTLMSKATVDPKTAKLKFPAEVMTDLNNYLALAPNGANAEAARALFTTLGEKPKPSSSGFWNSLNNVVQNMQQQQAAGPDPITAASNQAAMNMEIAREQAAARDEMRREEQERQREAERQRQADEERRREARQEVAEQRCNACTSNPDVARYEGECKSAGGGAQAPCYRAAAALCSCQISAGGCGSSISSLQQCVKDNNGLADYLKSNAPTFGRGGSGGSGGNGANDQPQKFEWVSQRCAKRWGNAAETACMHFESREKCEGYKGQPCVRDTSKIPPGAAIPAITDQY